MNRTHRRWGLSLLLLLLHLSISFKYIHADSLYFEKHDLSNLTDLSMNDLAQDDRGYLWIATGSGIIQYNGSDPRLFNRKSHPQLPSDNILSLEFVPSSREIWIGTDAGALSYNLDNEKLRRIPFRFRRSRQDKVRIAIVDIESSGSGEVFAITSDGVYWSQADASLDQISVDIDKNLREFAGFVGLAADGRGGIWAASNEAVKKWDPPSRSFQYVFPISEARSIAARGDEIWIGTTSSLLISYHIDTGAVKRYSVHPETTAIAFDRENRIWAGSRNHGIAVVNTQTGNVEMPEIDYEHPYRLSSGRIKTLLGGIAGHMWVGTADSGLLAADLNKYNRLTYLNRSDPQSLPVGAVNVVFEDSLGYLWAGSETGGLFRVDRRGSDMKRYTHEADDEFSLPGDQVTSIIEDSQGRVWVGTDDGPSLYIPEIDGFEHPDNFFSRWPDIQHRNVIALSPGSENNIWMALSDGDLYQLDVLNRDFKTYHYTPADVPSHLMADHRGVLWAGSRKSLRLFDTEGVLLRSWAADGLDNGGIPEGGITTIFQDSRKRIWLGTLREALLLDHVSGEFTSIRLPGDRGMFVSGITEDNAGNIWISEERGVHIFDPAGEFITTMNESIGFSPFGLIKNMALGSHGRVYIAAAGEIWEYESYIVSHVHDLPPVFLNEIKVFNDVIVSGRQIDKIDVLVLNHDENVLSIGFGTVDYHDERHYRYQYRLNDSRGSWLDSGGVNSVTFANLPSGRYRFAVRAYSENGVVSAHEAQLAIRILPSFWQTGWAIAIYIAAALALMITLIKLREGRVLKTQVKELEIARGEVLEVNRKLEFLTMNDSLTGLLNRRGFDKAFAHALRTARRNSLMVTVFMVDVDFFKLYNDNYGHLRGDEVLRRMGHAFRCVFERSTDIIARYGGEEFAVVFIGDSPAAALKPANELITAVKDLQIRHEYSKVNDYITFSAGISTIHLDADTNEEALLQRADKALYHAKLVGRNRVCFTAAVPELPERMANGIAPLVFEPLG